VTPDEVIPVRLLTPDNVDGRIILSASIHGAEEMLGFLDHTLQGKRGIRVTVPHLQGTPPIHTEPLLRVYVEVL